MEIRMIDIYRSPNIGVYLKANERYLLAPRGLAPTKSSKIASWLNARIVSAAVGGSRLLGPLVAMNSNGILVSRMIEDHELRSLSSEAGLSVERVPSRYTCIGNLVAANDKGAVISPLVSDCSRLISEVLRVPTVVSTVSSYLQVGSLIVATNCGCIIHPGASSSEINDVSKALGVKVTVATVNGGVPFVSSGVVANSRRLIAGNLTSGPELAIISQAFE